VSRILVVDDEPQIVRALRLYLKARGWEVVAVATGGQALDAVAKVQPDLVLLDLGLPDLDGVDVITTLRGWTSVPIVVLSGRTQSQLKVKALDAGADDYVTKPFNVDELLARVNAVVRRSSADDDTAVPVVRIGAATIDLSRHLVTVAADDGSETPLHLTRTEWLLLQVLLRNPGRLVTQKELIEAVRGPAYANAGQYLRQYMAQLRAKLEPNPARPRHLLTEPGIGYRYQP